MRDPNNNGCASRRQATATRSRDYTKRGPVIAAFLLFLIDPTIWDKAIAQVSTPEPPSVYQFKLGYLCHRVSDGGIGAVRRDACGRWYCGDRNVKDIVEERPNIASEVGCSWRIEGSRCVCRRPWAAPVVPGARKKVD